MLHFSYPTPASLAGDDEWLHLYEASFRPAVRDEPADILALLQTPRGVAVRASDERGTVGMAVLQILRDYPALLLWHLVLDPALRGQRLGGELFEHALGAAADAARRIACRVDGLAFEFDPPEFAEDEAQRHRRERRAHFFRSHGARALGGVFPRPAPDGIVERAIAYLPLAGGWPTEEEEARLVSAIRRERYGLREEVQPSGAW